MAHEIDMTTGRAGMAYMGDTPWHGLGQKLTDGASLETWQQEAGLDWGRPPMATTGFLGRFRGHCLGNEGGINRLSVWNDRPSVDQGDFIRS